MNKPLVEHRERDRVLNPAETAMLIVDAQMSAFNDAKRAEKPECVQPIDGRALPAIKRLINTTRSMGYYMICAEDGCATYSADRHQLALKAFGGSCRVQTVDDVIATLEPVD